ncbi:hypothetical protein A1O3_00962 [Capronia epimyces CBS 606.96]|uniref:Uncharacterized protein n=1 Tax=Capronia epimyces CBS 606.96 TaxID=1182542 RepID=W9YT42_9EURO|nr:uncharacterized protein A1O3_00962 [Capronia epimyces CBS 606.96]EXJ92411.1 hypothetical protein A1O3_00962 [Capronia epimyces CBS 606.96]
MAVAFRRDLWREPQGTWYLDERIAEHETCRIYLIEPDDKVLLRVKTTHLSGQQGLVRMTLSHVRYNEDRASSRVSWRRLRRSSYTRSQPYRSNYGTTGMSIDVFDRYRRTVFHCDQVRRGRAYMWRIRLWDGPNPVGELRW